MRINAQITATMLVFTAILMSGCMDASDTDDATLDQADGAGDDAEDLSENITNTAPVADLVPDVTSGEAPLTVNFTIEASDEDGDNLTWAIDLDGDNTTDLEGEGTEAVVNHTFDSAGNHTVTLTVDDGTNTTTSQVVIEVVEAVAEPVESGPLQEFTGSWVTSTPGECYGVGGISDLHDVSHVVMDIIPETYGMDFEAVFAATTGDAGDAMVDWYDGGGWMETSGGWGALQTTITGTVPGGAIQAKFLSCGQGDVTVTYQAG